MGNGKDNQLKKSLIVFCCMMSMVLITMTAAGDTHTITNNTNIDEEKKKLEEENKVLRALIPGEKSCHKKLETIRDISTGALSDIEDTKIIQGIVDAYLAFPEGDNCKFAFGRSLEILARTLNDEITFYEKKLLLTRVDSAEISEIRENKKRAENIFFMLKEVIPTAELEEKIIVTFADYPAFSINLYGGIESQSVDTVTSPNIPRLGLLVYQSNNNDDRKGLHVYGNFLLTGSAEATESTDNDPDQTLEMNFNVFYAFWKNDLDDKYALIGPVVSVGALKTSAKNEIYMPKKRYAGIRSALNPETYAEILFGTTSGLRSQRLELRLQAPIERFRNGSRIFVGGVFNMAYDKRVEGEPDSASIYLSWHVPFGKLWNVNNDK